MKKKISKILIVFLFLMFTLTTVSNALGEAYALEKSDAYKRWESLSEEERKNTIMPRYYDISILNSMKRSRYNNLLRAGSSTDSIYNLTDLYNAIVRDQKLTMSCWAFSTISSLESNISIRNTLPLKGYSPYHMEYYATKIYNKTFASGGNIYQAVAYMANGYGPVLENDFPMESVYDEQNNDISNRYLTDLEDVDLNKIAQLKINKTTEFPAIYKEYTETGIVYTDANGTQYSQADVEAVRTIIKKHIREYGAVIASMYIDIAISTGGEFVSDNYDSENNIFCYTGSDKNANHQVAIVGWDDEKEAYIVQNSYGKEFGENGFFYISYDDVRIEEGIYGITDIEKLTEDSYDNVYQYDELGMNYSVGFGTPEIYYANVFDRNANTDGKDEYIDEIGLYIINTTGIEIYVNSKDGKFVDANNNSKLKLVSSGEILEPGYHVIELNATEDTKLTGNEFIVAVKAINQENAWIPVESNLKESGFTYFSTPYDTATANEGESLYSGDGKNWYEINGLKVGYTAVLANTNVCIKAFTKYSNPAPTTIAVTGVELDKNSITLNEGETETLTATVLPTNATNKNVTWTSSNNAVAKISNGVVTAVSEGTATITVTTEDGNHTATCQVTVEKEEEQTVAVTSVTLNQSEKTLKIGETLTLVPTINPENATNKNVRWTSSNSSVATISNGVVTAVAEGTATITVTTEDGNCTATCRITVEREQVVETVNVTSVRLNKTEETLKVGETLTLIPTINPENATNKNVRWASSNNAVATISNGVVTAVTEGTATITVTTEDGNRTATCQITVEPVTQEQVVRVTGVEMTVTTVEVTVGTIVTLSANVVPSNATNKNITWESSNTEVAEIRNGVINTLRPGTATITVKTEDGNFTDTCELTVRESNPEVRVESIELNKDDIKMEVGDKSTLTVTFNPSDPTNKKVTWTSSNTKVATVDENGIVTAVGPGKAVITATSEDGGHEAKANVTVTKQVEDPDDIYKDPEQEGGKDTTISDKELPHTGIQTLIFFVALTIISVMAYSFIRYRRLRDVK